MDGKNLLIQRLLKTYFHKKPLPFIGRLPFIPPFIYEWYEWYEW